MPEEFSRTTKVKTIDVPGGEDVKFPVITKVSFIDPFKQYQEYQYEVDNSVQGDRRVHVVNVYGESATQPIQVERLEIWKHVDPFSRYQESQVEFDNINGESNTPPSFDIANGGSHLKTHVVRWYRDQNQQSTNWVDVEYIDRFSVIDPKSQYQETIFELRNPTQEEADAMDLDSDPDITDASIDPPYRTDPFQNIVNFSGAAGVSVSWAFFRTDVSSGGDEPYIVSASWAIISTFIGGGGGATVVVTSPPTVTPSSFAPAGNYVLLGETPLESTAASFGIPIEGVLPGAGQTGSVPTGDVAVFNAGVAAITVDGVPWVLNSTFISSIFTLVPLQSMGNIVNVSATFAPP